MDLETTRRLVRMAILTGALVLGTVRVNQVHAVPGRETQPDSNAVTLPEQGPGAATPPALNGTLSFAIAADIRSFRRSQREK